MWSNERFSSITTTMCSIWSRRRAASSVGAGIRSGGVGGTGAAATSTTCRHRLGQEMGDTPRSAARSASPDMPLTLPTRSASRAALIAAGRSRRRRRRREEPGHERRRGVELELELRRTPFPACARSARAGPGRPARSGTRVSVTIAGRSVRTATTSSNCGAERALGDVQLGARQPRRAVLARARGSPPSRTTSNQSG